MACSPAGVERTARRKVSSGVRVASRWVMAKPMPCLVRSVAVQLFGCRKLELTSVRSSDENCACHFWN